MTLHEPDVSLTDLGLAILCALFAMRLMRHGARDSPVRSWFVLFFMATGIAALLGAIAHGFVPDTRSILYRILWIGIFAAIGIAAVASWGIGSRLLFPDVVARRVLTGVLIVFGIYLLVVLFVSQSFLVAILHYLPAAIFLLIAFIVANRRRRETHLAAGIFGVALTFVAALVQQSGLALHDAYFDHNALYHLIQAIALFLIFIAAVGLTRPEPP